MGSPIRRISNDEGLRLESHDSGGIINNYEMGFEHGTSVAPKFQTIDQQHVLSHQTQIYQPSSQPLRPINLQPTSPHQTNMQQPSPQHFQPSYHYNHQPQIQQLLPGSVVIRIRRPYTIKFVNKS